MLVHFQHELYFHCARIVTNSGELKTRFTGVVEKENDGAEGQELCFRQMLVNLIPNSFKVTLENVYNWAAGRMKPDYFDLGMEIDSDIEEEDFLDELCSMPNDFDE